MTDMTNPEPEPDQTVPDLEQPGGVTPDLDEDADQDPDQDSGPPGDGIDIPAHTEDPAEGPR